jgi:hypothetical protein
VQDVDVAVEGEGEVAGNGAGRHWEMGDKSSLVLSNIVDNFCMVYAQQGPEHQAVPEPRHAHSIEGL